MKSVWHVKVQRWAQLTSKHHHSYSVQFLCISIGGHIAETNRYEPSEAKIKSRTVSRLKQQHRYITNPKPFYLQDEAYFSFFLSFYQFSANIIFRSNIHTPTMTFGTYQEMMKEKKRNAMTWHPSYPFHYLRQFYNLKKTRLENHFEIFLQNVCIGIGIFNLKLFYGWCPCYFVTCLMDQQRNHSILHYALLVL